MIIRALAENTSTREDLGHEHGLSLYVETKKHKLLFDTGASGLFSENAAKLGVDLSQIDLVVLSHGHYDHSGGLRTFLQINHASKVYLHEKAIEPHYANRPNGEKKYIGLDQSLLPNERFVFCGDHLVLDEGLMLFSGVKGNRLAPSGNADLFKKTDDGFTPDDFSHEQNLIIHEDGKWLLIAGCAHKGIVNILEQFRSENGFFPDYVIGGFHLYNHGTKESERPEIVTAIGEYLLSTQARYYTCHCTGIEAYQHLKTVMGEKIEYCSTGTQLIL